LKENINNRFCEVIRVLHRESEFGRNIFSKVWRWDLFAQNLHARFSPWNLL